MGFKHWLLPILLGVIIVILGMVLIAVPGKAPTTEKSINGNDNSEDLFVGIPDLIEVALPKPDALVKSPLELRGMARGNWYFEASFPVRLFDATNKELSVMPMQAEGEWMTAEFVPFSGVLIFEEPATATGTLVFEKDNPSGEPEFDRSYEMTVRFR